MNYAPVTVPAAASFDQFSPLRSRGKGVGVSYAFAVFSPCGPPGRRLGALVTARGEKCRPGRLHRSHWSLTLRQAGRLGVRLARPSGQDLAVGRAGLKPSLAVKLAPDLTSGLGSCSGRATQAGGLR